MRIITVVMAALAVTVAVPVNADNPVYQAPSSLAFLHITTTNGLPASRIFSVIQDRQGYIWAGSENGLARYDGYGTKTFRHTVADATSLSGNIVRGMFMDDTGHLWFGLYDGTLDLYQPQTGGFVHIALPGHPEESQIWTLNGKGHQLWLGTIGHGLYVFDTKTRHFTHFVHDPAKPDSLASDQINNIYLAADGTVWLATGMGLDSYTPGSHQFVHHFFGKSSHLNTWDIAADDKGNLWIATKKGLYEGRSDKTFYKALPNNQVLGRQEIRTLLFTEHKYLWIGSFGGGVWLLNTHTNQLSRFSHDPAVAASLADDHVWTIYRDHDGILWFATDLGLNALTSNAFHINVFTNIIRDGVSTPIGQITGLLADRNRLYVATSNGLLVMTISDEMAKAQRVNSQWTDALAQAKTGKAVWVGVGVHSQLLEISENNVIQNSRYVTHEGKSINEVISIADDGADLWLGSFGLGLFRFNPRNGDTLAYPMPTGNLWSEVNELRLHGKTLLMGTESGVAVLNTATGQIHIVPGPADIKGLFSVVSIYQTGKDRYLLGTSVGLLQARFDPPRAVPTLTLVPGLAGNSAIGIVGIEQDKHGNFWLSSNEGLIRYNPRSGKIQRLTRANGLPFNLFTIRAHAKTADGRLWFGGPYGLVSFVPSQLHLDTHVPHVVMESMTYFLGSTPHSRVIYGSEPVSFDHFIKTLQFSFSALNYIYSADTNYRYRVQGLENTWINLGAHHALTLSNLAPGTYTLEIEASNTLGVWSKEPTSFNFRILPPWWRTWWAYAVYVLLILGSMFAYVYIQQRKLRREREISTRLRDADTIKSNFVQELESRVGLATDELRNSLDTLKLKNQELEVANQRASEGEQLKSQFLANMSHELRTPLTAIQGYLKLLSGTRVSVEQADYLRTVRHSSESLLAIINDSLDLSRIESGKLLIDEVEFDLLELIESTLELLGPSAYSKRLALLRIVPPEIPLRLRGDPLRIRQILTNLVGNAIKFTQRGSICVRVREIERQEKELVLGIAVSDTGIGIPPEGITRLFQAYERHEPGGQPIIEGTGLGLSICKKLLDLMGGSIEAMSTPRIGSTFEFHLPFKLRRQSLPDPVFDGQPAITLLDNHPLSHQAWRASLSRLGLDVTSARKPLMVKSLLQGILFIVLGMDEMENPEALAAELEDASPQRLLLVPTLDRSKLEYLGSLFHCTALSALAHEANIASVLGTLMPPTPAGGTEATTAPDHSAPSAAEHTPMILVADDNAINRKLLVTLLIQNGYRVLEAASGPALLELAGTHAWDLALVDIHMPGMDGIEATGKLIAKAGVSHPPVIAVSADALPETRTRALAAGMRDYLVKPYSEQQLLEMVARYLPKSNLSGSRKQDSAES